MVRKSVLLSLLIVSLLTVCLISISDDSSGDPPYTVSFDPNGGSGTMDSVAHFAHLGGMIAGIIMILYWKHNGTLTRGNGFY